MENEKSSPVVAKVFGIINIVYGSLMLGITLLSIFFRNKFSSMGGGEIAEQMKDLTHQFYSNPKVEVITYASSAILLILLVILIIAGIKLLKKELIGRTLSIVYGWCAIGYTIILTLASYLIINPIFKEIILASDIPEKAQKAILISINFQGITNICCVGFYPIILLIFVMPQKFYNYLVEPEQPESNHNEELSS